MKVWELIKVLASMPFDKEVMVRGADGKWTEILGVDQNGGEVCKADTWGRVFLIPKSKSD